MQIKNNILMLLKNRNALFVVCLVLIALIGVVVNVKILHLWDYKTEGEDIYYTWIEGKRIIAGENPYARVLSGNMRQNQKYATYFPAFYLLSSFTQLVGFREYSAWISLWKPIFLIFNIGIAGLIFYQLTKRRLLPIGLFAALFWLLNRWTLHVTKIAQLDFIPIFFLILSLAILHRHKYSSFLIFGLSLAFKQIAIFVLPLYLIWAWQSAELNKLKNTLIALGLILFIPALTSLPFIFWSAEGFFKSILFSATRNPSSEWAALSLDALIREQITDFVGIKAKLPMLLLMSLVFLSAMQRQIGVYTSVLLIMSVFVDYNSVLFRQYFCWIVPFIPLVVCDIRGTRE